MCKCLAKFSLFSRSLSASVVVVVAAAASGESGANEWRRAKTFKSREKFASSSSSKRKRAHGSIVAAAHQDSLARSLGKTGARPIHHPRDWLAAGRSLVGQLFPRQAPPLARAQKGHVARGRGRPASSDLAAGARLTGGLTVGSVEPARRCLAGRRVNKLIELAGARIVRWN